MSTRLFRSALAVLAASLFLFPASSAFSQTFQHTTYFSPNGPDDLFVADLNHDGRDDIVTTQANSNMVTVFLNHGNGTFTSGGSATYLVGAAPNRVVVADFNHDGNPDIVTGNCSNGGTHGSLSLLLGRGDGTFQPPADFELSACPTGLGFMTVASDVAPSLLVSTGSADMTLLRNDGKGNFTSQTVPGTAGTTLQGGSAADYNRDGVQDIAAIMVSSATNPIQEEIVVFFGNSSGTFSTPVVVANLQPNQQAFDVNTVDFTGDGIADLIVPRQDTPSNTAGLLTLANDGTGNFTAVDLNTDSNHIFPGIKAVEADFNNDGFHELLEGVIGLNSAPNAIAMWMATSTDSWRPPVYFSVAQQAEARSVAVGHFNTDRLPDFATITTDSVLHVFLNTSQPVGCAVPGQAGVSICSPNQGTGVVSPIFISAAANGGSKPITAMKAYLDGKAVAGSSSNLLTAKIPTTNAVHTLTVNAWNSSGVVFKSTVTFTVR